MMREVDVRGLLEPDGPIDPVAPACGYTPVARCPENRNGEPLSSALLTSLWQSVQAEAVELSAFVHLTFDGEETACGKPARIFVCVTTADLFLAVKQGLIAVPGEEPAKAGEVGDPSGSLPICTACDAARAVRVFGGASPSALLAALEVLEAFRDDYVSGDESGEWECPLCHEPLDGTHIPECLIGRAGAVVAALDGSGTVAGGSSG